MKSLTQHINEWKASSNSMVTIKDRPYFIYEIKTYSHIKVFSKHWKQFNDYKDNVYINNEHVPIESDGITRKAYDPGKYKVFIKNIDNVTNCWNMFFECTQLVSVPSFDTSNVKNMNQMFFNCKNLKEVELFDTKNVTRMDDMFFGCDEFISVPLFDTRNVETMTRMFIGCKKLKDIPLFDISKLKYMEDMFCNCDNLSQKTKDLWGKIYDFWENRKKK